MPLRLVTCPDTAHLELISYQEDPLGILVDECSRFAPSCLPTCPRTCAERIDRRARMARELGRDGQPRLDVGDDTNLGIAIEPPEGDAFERLRTAEP